MKEVLVGPLSLYLKPNKDLDSPNPTPCPFVLLKILQRNRINIVVESLSHVHLFAILWTAACQASLSFTISQSLLKLMSIESVMPYNHLILCDPLLFLPSIFPSIRVFSGEFGSGPHSELGSLHQVTKVLELQLQHQSPSVLQVTGKVVWY